MNTAFVSLRRVKDNYCLLSKGKNVFCVVKCDAYGHGMTEISQALLDAGAKRFCVANGAEALTLRKVLPTAEILLLSPAETHLTRELIAAGIIFSVSDYEYANRLSRSAAGYDIIVPVHIACNSGMNRLGFPIGGDALSQTLSELKSVSRLSHLAVSGIYTHLMDDCYSGLTQRQTECFFTVLPELLHIFPGCECHIAATQNLPYSFPKISCPLAYRIGFGLYGYGAKGVLPAMSIRTQILHLGRLSPGDAVGYGGDFRCVEPTNFAVTGIGYGDGLPRLLSGAFFSAGHHRFPVGVYESIRDFRRRRAYENRKQCFGYQSRR